MSLRSDVCAAILGALPKETVDIHSAMEKRKGMTK